MSTPSTLTATLPPPHTSHYGYSRGQPYQTSPHRYASTNSAMNGSSRLAQSYNHYSNNTPASIPRNPSHTSLPKQQPSQAMPTSHSASSVQSSRKRERSRGPDWNEFYKNGVPKEIIVIDDDTPPPPEKPETRRMENERPNHTTRTLVRNDSFEQHAAKKRRTAQGNAYQQDPYQQPAYSYKTRSDEGSSGANTISTERTTSLHTTAPTSLGSHTSQGSAGAYLDDGVVGQKRKRVTRQAVADEKKRQDIEIIGEAYASYVPPPKPPIKAKDVHVPPIKDVSTAPSEERSVLMNEL
jgi:dual-specificity kinase